MKAFRNHSDNLDLFVQMFNNEQTMKRYFPKTYEAYENTIQGTRDNFADGREEFYDITVLHAAYEDEHRENLIVTLQANGVDPQGYCILEGSAINQKTGNVLTPSIEPNFLGDGEILDVRIPMNGCDLEDIQLSAMLYTVDNHIDLYQCEDNLSGFLLENKAEFQPEIKAPVITHANTENKDINIAYYYRLGMKEDCLDYFYSYEQMKDGFVRIPSEGSFIVKDTILTSPTAILSVRNAQKKQFYHWNPVVDVIPIGSDTKVSWNIDSCWKDVKVRDLIEHLYEYVEYTLSITAISQAKRISFEITNRQCSPTERRHVFEKIYIYRDCFLEDTMVTMSDGSKKKIQDLKQGDLVKTEAQKTATVHSVLVYERMESIAHIQLSDQTELFLTSNHPLKTKDGFRCAFLLENGQELETDHGFLSISQVCSTPEQLCKVVSVELEEGHQFYANGILASDSSIEAVETAKALNMRYQVEPSWRKDYDGWQMKNEESKNVRQCWKDISD